MRGKLKRGYYLQEHLRAWQEYEDLFTVCSRLMLVRNVVVDIQDLIMRH